MLGKNILPLHTLMPITKQLQQLPVEPPLSLQQVMGLIRRYIAPHTARGSMELAPILDVLQDRYEMTTPALRAFYRGLQQHATNMQVRLVLTRAWQHKLDQNRLTNTQDLPVQALPMTPMREASTQENLPAMAPQSSARITPPPPSRVARPPVAAYNASHLPGRAGLTAGEQRKPTSQTDDPTASKFVQQMFKNLYDTPLPLMSNQRSSK
ncbi:MAG: hypothetical protein EP343_05910 [Deltaproteobacteria bacterium]|nr:MAG: hypothetical protein EP343_05910 [Deltaproteobacteria bacterium]